LDFCCLIDKAVKKRNIISIHLNKCFMKIRKFKAIALITVGLFLLGSCGNTSQEGHSEMHSHNEKEKDHDESSEMGDHMHDEGMEGHMEHMSDVRTWLKTELGDKYDKEVPASTDEGIMAGKTVFMKVCQSCHGTSGKGDGPAAAGLDPKPADFTDPGHSMFYSDMGRLHIIKKGITGTVMVGWENILSETEINNVYAYVKSLRNTMGDEGHDEHNHSH
jgi:mono/diheme cytochrome c family protein